MLLVPMRLPALLAAKLLGGMVFGLIMAAVTLAISAVAFGVDTVRWGLLIPVMILSAAAFSALGVLVSVAVKEVFEAQTLANALRFPMIFLGGAFVPVSSLPPGLKVVARLLPLTYGVEGLGVALGRGTPARAMLDMAVLTAFTAVLFVISTRILARRTA
ncbi:MAG: ABC transporter permease [Anaerolineae bacterium]